MQKRKLKKNKQTNKKLGKNGRRQHTEEDISMINEQKMLSLTRNQENAN